MIPVYRDGKVFVCERMCDSCIFRPGNLMQLNPGTVDRLVATATADFAGNIVCHEFMSTDEPAVCYGFFRLHATGLLQMAERMGVVEFKPL